MADWVEVAYALPDQQFLVTIPLEAEMTVLQAIERSGVQKVFPGIDLERDRVGIFGCVCRLDRVLNPGERVEIYRPLLIDPKDARRLRAS